MKHIGKVVGVLGIDSTCGLMALPLSTFSIEKKNQVAEKRILSSW